MPVASLISRGLFSPVGMCGTAMMPMASRRPPASKRSPGEAVRLRPADPFDLIRWLARSQGDPRKAVAELVQNSLDAGATHITIERRRIGGAPALVIVDDGEGVLPEMSRDDALRHLAQHIGHSRKAKLTPLERRERIIAGKYGVGLLGFWSLGRRFELRSRVAGGKTLALALVEDEPGGRIVAMPPHIGEAETFTEAVVLDLHETALRSLGGARLASYLGSELRGQLLSRHTQLVVHDGMARGTSQKRFEVHPRRFLGEKLDLPSEIPVAGYAPIRVEIYIARGQTDAAVQIACGGTVVAESVRELGGLEIGDDPWLGRELVGVLDFPDFNVPPGSRRGVAPDAAARAFVDGLATLRSLVDHELGRFARQRDRAAQRDLAKELRRALRGLAARLPHYELPEIKGEGSGGPGAGSTRGGGLAEPVGSDVVPEGLAGLEGAGVGDEDDGDAPEPRESLELFAPGDLASARIVPDAVVLRPGRERRVRAEALDEDERIIRRKLSYRWILDGTDSDAAIEIRGHGGRPALVASPAARAGVVAGTLRVAIEEDGIVVHAAAPVVVEDGDDAGGSDHGIPEPLFESDARGGWRSRFDGPRWIVNDAHEDWIALRVEPRTRLRYVLSLFAKDVVLRSYALPGSSEVLERMVEILAHAERNLRGAG